VRVITDHNGIVEAERIYEPFGAIAIETSTDPTEDHGYIGERHDRDAGLLYLNARYMDPELGMFLQPDWFEQRGLWCRLNWFDPVLRPDGLYVKTRAQCGEDASRSYWLAFDLDTSGDPARLTLIWDEALENGPMRLCAQL